MQDTEISFGEVCRASCGAVGRYIGNGLVLFVSAMDNDLATDKVASPVNKGNPYNLPLPSDFDIERYMNDKNKYSYSSF